VAVYFLQVLSR